MTTRAIAAALVAASALAAPAAAEPPLPSGLFRVGGTGIMCVREPCPRIGFVPLDGAGQRKRSWPVYSGGEPPELEGAEADRAAIRAAWSPDGCLIVEGAFTQPRRFSVRRIAGPCRK